MKNTVYTPELAKQLIKHYASGMIISDICKLAEMPCKTTFYAWRNAYPEFDQALESVEKQRAQAVAEDVLDVADNEPDPQAARVRMQARQWYASKFNRQKFGEKLEVNHEHKVSITSVMDEANARLQSLNDQSDQKIIDVIPEHIDNTE